MLSDAVMILLMIKARKQRREANYPTAATDKSNESQAGPEVPVSLYITFKCHDLRNKTSQSLKGVKVWDTNPCIVQLVCPAMSSYNQLTVVASAQPFSSGALE